jgi:hypothetical protein
VGIVLVTFLLNVLDVAMILWLVVVCDSEDSALVGCSGVLRFKLSIVEQGEGRGVEGLRRVPATSTALCTGKTNADCTALHMHSDGRLSECCIKLENEALTCLIFQ